MKMKADIDELASDLSRACNKAFRIFDVRWKTYKPDPDDDGHKFDDRIDAADRIYIVGESNSTPGDHLPPPAGHSPESDGSSSSNDDDDHNSASGRLPFRMKSHSRRLACDKHAIAMNRKRVLSTESVDASSSGREKRRKQGLAIRIREGRGEEEGAAR